MSKEHSIHLTRILRNVYHLNNSLKHCINMDPNVINMDPNVIKMTKLLPSPCHSIIPRATIIVVMLYYFIEKSFLSTNITELYLFSLENKKKRSPSQE